jgi:SAM-dependent methyltransferase
MTKEIQVFEPATPETFHARGYLLANTDLRKAFGDDEAKAQWHFYEYGVRENRLQASRAYLVGQRIKFNRFKTLLFACDSDSFPVSFGRFFHDISEYKNESANPGYGFWNAELTANPDKLYADIGAGLRHVVYPNCVYVEVYRSLTADILIDPHCELPFKGAALDGIGCFAVLEHVDKPWKMASEFARVVKPGGKIFIDWPFLQPVHGYPSHYYNATREGLRRLFQNEFEINELYTGANQGPDYTVNWILNALLSSIKDDAVYTRLAKTTIGELCQQPPRTSEFWQTILSALDDDAISMLSCGNILIARKR